jgi:hypothetical protein
MLRAAEPSRYAVAVSDVPRRGARRRVRRVERVLIGAVMAVIAFVVERVVIRSLKRTKSSSSEAGK